MILTKVIESKKNARQLCEEVEEQDASTFAYPRKNNFDKLYIIVYDYVS